MNTQFARTLALAAVACLTGHAASITGFIGPLSGTGTFSGIVSGPNVVITENVNSFDPTTGFWGLLTVASPPYSATTYDVTKVITNNTNSIWTSYQVGFGCDAATAFGRGTVDCYSSGLSSQLNAAPAITTTSGVILQPNNVYFDVMGMNVAPGQSLTLTFKWDSCVSCTAVMPMYQYANVASNAPEPASFILFGTGLLIPFWLRRRIAITGCTLST